MESLLPWLLNFEEDINRNKDPKRAKIFWAKLAWEVTTCAEANEVFPDMLICPICMGRWADGAVDHKLKDDIFN